MIPYGLETDDRFRRGDRHSARQPGHLSMACRGNGGLDTAGRASFLGGGLKLLLKTVTLRQWHRAGNFGPKGLHLDTKPYLTLKKYSVFPREVPAGQPPRLRKRDRSAWGSAVECYSFAILSGLGVQSLGFGVLVSTFPNTVGNASWCCQEPPVPIMLTGRIGPARWSC